MGQKGFWDLEQRQQKLNQRKDVLVTLNQIIPWKSFRELLESAREKPRKVMQDGNLSMSSCCSN
jgi:transposase, IS5 family